VLSSSSAARSDPRARVRALRLAVYTDYPYQRQGDAIYTERAFVIFLEALAGSIERMVLTGRLNPVPGRGERSHYRVADTIDFVPLPHYHTLARPRAVVGAMVGSMRAFWRLLGRVDAVWLLGPHPLCLPFAGLAALRGKRVFLGVRQDLQRYARARHPGRRGVHLAADLLEGSYRVLARRCPTIVVGPDLARKYAQARRLLPISVSLIRASAIPTEHDLPARRYDGEVRVLTVGRLESEKNPLMLADVLARLSSGGRRWRLLVCGEGPLAESLRERFRRLGVEGQAELIGYLPINGGLLDLYRECHAFLHVSWTEGVPQVLFESFAVGLPVVATKVGGVSDAVGDAALLVPPGDAAAAAAALERLVAEPGLRGRLAVRGLERARAHTIEAECSRIVAFMEGVSAADR
jgi:glycosyltransferase involved in cell wall biosynthesis